MPRQLATSGDVVGDEDAPLVPPEHGLDLPGHRRGPGRQLRRLVVTAAGAACGSRLLQSEQVPTAHRWVVHHEAVVRGEGLLRCHVGVTGGKGQVLEPGEGAPEATGEQTAHEGAPLGPGFERMQDGRQRLAAHGSEARQRTEVGNGLVEETVGGRTQGQRETSCRVRRRRWVHERRAVPVEHRPEELLNELLLLFRSGDEALMRQQSVRQTVGPVQGRELLHGGSGIDVQQRQGVIAAVPRKEGRVALTVGHVECPAEGFDPVVAEEGGAAVLQVVGHGRGSAGREVEHYSGSVASASARRGSTSRGRTTDAAAAARVASS